MTIRSRYGTEIKLIGLTTDQKAILAKRDDGSIREYWPWDIVADGGTTEVETALREVGASLDNLS